MRLLQMRRILIIILMFIFFLFNLNLSFLFWHYLHLISYPFLWLVFYHYQKRKLWIIGLFLSLVADYFLGLPFGFNALTMALLEFVSYWLKSFYRSLGRLYLFFGLLMMNLFLFLFWLIFLPHLWGVLIFYLLLSDCLLIFLIKLDVGEL